MEKSLRATLIRAVASRNPGTGPVTPAVSQYLGINSAWLLLARVAVQAQAVLLTVLVARRLGEAGFGQYSLIASLIFLGNVFTTFGTDTLLIRQIAQARQVEIPEVPAALGLQIAFSAVTVTAIWLLTLFLPQKSAEFLTSLRLYSISLFPLAFFSIFSAILRGFERMDLYLIASLGTVGVQLATVWLALQAGGGLPGLMSALLAVQIFSMIFGYWLCKRTAPAYSLGWSVNLLRPARLLAAVWPLAMLSILGVVYQRMGVFALAFLGNDAQTGLYSAAARIIEALKLGQIAVAGALLPALARLQDHPEGAKEAARLFRKTAWSLVGLGLLGALITFFCAAPFIRLLYGPRYAAAASALRILGWMLLPYSLSTALAVEMVSKKMEKYVTMALALGLLSCAGLDLGWIPRWGVHGACLAAIVGEITQMGALWGLRTWHERRIWL